MTAPYSMDLRERAMARKAAGETNHEVLAVIHLDANNRVVSQELVWATQ